MIRISLASTATVVLSAMLAVSARAEEKFVLAVFDLENDGTALSRKEVERVTDLIAAELAASRQFQVVPKSQLKAALTSKKSESYESCYAESCQIEIGKEVAAQQILSSRVQQFGKTCMLTLTLFDLRKSTSVGGATERSGCDLESLAGAVKPTVVALARSMEPSSAAAARPASASASSEPVPQRAEALGTIVDPGQLMSTPGEDVLSPFVQLGVSRSLLDRAHETKWEGEVRTLNWRLQNAASLKGMRVHILAEHPNGQFVVLVKAADARSLPGVTSDFVMIFQKGGVARAAK